MTKLHKFYSDDAWIEGAAVDALDTLQRSFDDIISLAAMPDLQPGKYGPTGCGMLSADLHPSIVGSDIGCGMGLYSTPLKPRKLRLDKLVDRLKTLDEPWDACADAIAHAGLPVSPYDIGLGSIGLGNHFLEFQAVNEIVDAEAAAAAGIVEDGVYILVHTGSRALGYSVFDPIIRQGTLTLKAGSEEAEAYMLAHDHALAWAKLNRQVIASRAADEARCGEIKLVADISHNFVEKAQGGFLHRKGAATATQGLVPVPGSRETLSYLVKPVEDAPATALACIAHGAGRKYDRGAMHGRIEKTKSMREKMSRNPFGGYVVCEDRNLLIEEAAAAYKNIDAVVEDLTKFRLSTVVASFKPLLTFKTGHSSVGERDRR